MLNQKFLTRLLNDEYRQKVLISDRKYIISDTYKIPQYAQYVVDCQVNNRSKILANDKKAFYGFQPINALCSVNADGIVDTKMFEFKTVNHFLKLKENKKAVEVVECILAEIAKLDKTVVSFDPDKIDAELKRLESEYVKQKEAEKKQKDVSKSSELSAEDRSEKETSK